MSESSVRIAVNGAAGRMGRQLLSAVGERSDAHLSAALDAPGQACIGADVSVLASGVQAGVAVSDTLSDVLSEFDVIIDFSTPAASLALLDTVKGSGRRVVIGTTGFNAAQTEQLQAAATDTPIVFAANYSIGVTLSLALLQQAAAALGDDYDVEVVEAHHHHKVDAPSGTALAMGRALATGLNRSLDECAVYQREGIIGPREPGTIGFSTVRAGDIVGEHTVLFVGNGERLEITHKAHERMTFARGAVRAAVWLAEQPPGLYDMTDVLGVDKPQS